MFSVLTSLVFLGNFDSFFGLKVLLTSVSLQGERRLECPVYVQETDADDNNRDYVGYAEVDEVQDKLGCCVPADSTVTPLAI